MTSPGNTPLICLDGIFAKLECTNPTGSIKDRMAKYIIDRNEELGVLKPGMTIIEDSSGSSGIAFSYYGRLKGYRVIIVMPEHMSEERKQIIRDLGAELILSPRSGGLVEARKIKDDLIKKPNTFSPEQFSNPLNVECHAKTTGPEILKQLKEKNITQIDAFVAGVGTGGTLIGVAQALKSVFPNVKIVAIEPAESAVLSGGKPGSHMIQGIGIGYIPAIATGRDRLLHESIDEVLTISSNEAKDAAQKISEKFGYCVGISSGANFLAAQRIREKYKLTTVVTVFPDGYLKYQSHGLEHCGKGRCPYESTPAYLDLDKKVLLTIVSGGQTGVDRAALDVAIELGLPHKGWCPKGRLAEDGEIDNKYNLTETPAVAYEQRTQWNVRDSDATLILHLGTITEGTQFTLEDAQRTGKPTLVFDLSRNPLPNKEAFDQFLKTHHIQTLNIAGPRESHQPEEVYNTAQKALRWLLECAPTPLQGKG